VDTTRDHRNGTSGTHDGGRTRTRQRRRPSTGVGYGPDGRFDRGVLEGGFVVAFFSTSVGVPPVASSPPPSDCDCDGGRKRPRIRQVAAVIRVPVARGRRLRGGAGTRTDEMCPGGRGGDKAKKKRVLYIRARECAGHDENAPHSDVGHIGMRSTDPANGSSL